MSDIPIKEDGEIVIVDDTEEEGEVSDLEPKKLNMKDLNFIDGNAICHMCKMYHILQKAIQPDSELNECVRVHTVINPSIKDKFNDFVLCLNLECDKTCGMQHIHVPQPIGIIEMFETWKYELKELQNERKYANKILNPAYIKPPDYEANGGFMKHVTTERKFTYNTYVPRAKLIMRYKALRKEYLDRQINIVKTQKDVLVLEIPKISAAVNQCIKINTMDRIRELLKCAEYIQKNITILDMYIKLARQYSRKLRNNNKIDGGLSYFEKNPEGSMTIGICHKENPLGFLD